MPVRVVCSIGGYEGGQHATFHSAAKAWLHQDLTGKGHMLFEPRYPQKFIDAGQDDAQVADHEDVAGRVRSAVANLTVCGSFAKG